MLDLFFAAIGVLTEALIVLLLLRRRVYRTLPAFFVYLCWSVISDGVPFSLQLLHKTVPFGLYEAQMVIDSAMMFAVLVELSWSVLRPVANSLPKYSWIWLALLIAIAGALLWPVAGLTIPNYLTHEGANFFRLQQVFAILRVIVFLGMAAFSQVLAIGWRDRELQIAAGLGFYSITSLAISTLHTHQNVGSQYHWLDEVGAACYFGTLAYWVVSFTTKEVERKEFSPQMRDFLLILGGTARTSRAALKESVVTKTRPKDHQ